MNTISATTWMIIGVAIAIVCIAGIAAWLVYRKRRTERLRAQFGPEYVRELEIDRSRSRAEGKLEDRKKRVEQLHIRPLDAKDRTRFADSWRLIQGRFVDNPGAAAAEAEQLLREVMAARGYVLGDFEQEVADLSVDHPLVVEDYRAAHQIMNRTSAGRAATEELRQAMIHYRPVFEDLIGEPVGMRARAASA